jgi:hypothetical protein
MLAPYHPTPSDIEQYMRLRTAGRGLTSRILDTMPRRAVEAIGRELGVLRDDTLILDSEDMLGVIMDCCLFDWVEEGQNLVERYAEQHPPPPETDEAVLLEAMRRARYRILAPQSLVPGAGVRCEDVVTREPLFLMDILFSRSPDLTQYALATRTFPFGEYWTTDGAGLPITRSTAASTIRRLARKGLLVVPETGDGAGTHRMAIAIVRACLRHGAARHIRYLDPRQAPDLPGAPAPEF